MTLKIGDRAPYFELPSDEGKIISLNDFPNQKIILYFYPKDHTPGCTKEACDFRDSIALFKQHNTVILGISKDNPQKHQKFRQKYQLPFPLLADEKGEVCIAYGVIDKKSLFGNTFLGITRSTFLIDEKRMIQHIWRKVKVSNHIKEILTCIHSEKSM